MEAAFLLVEVALVPFAALLAALADVRDPRRRQGQRYSMRHLLLFSVLAVLTGATSYQGIITFIALQRERLNTVFGASFRRAPAVNTLRHLFLALGRDDLEAAFPKWIGFRVTFGRCFPKEFRDLHIRTRVRFAFTRHTHCDRALSVCVSC